MRFNIAQILGGPKCIIHTLHGFDEVVESLRWGLTELGHEVTVTPDRFSLDRPNIVVGMFGVDIIPIEVIDNLPADTIAYGLEQIAGVDPNTLTRPHPAVARRLRIWDHSAANIETWKKLNPRFDPVHVPVGWAPTLKRVPKRDQDIDILMYGMEGVDRLGAFGHLIGHWFKAVWVCGLYGSARDELIARSKLVLNINKYPGQRVFEFVRVSYLLGNGKAVVSDVHPEYKIDQDIRDAVAFATKETLRETCIRLIENPAQREQLEQRGPEVMAKRDIRPILAEALKSSGL